MTVVRARTDRNNNPTAFIVQMAQEAGLILGKDYEQGDSFIVNNSTYYTAKLLGDPIDLTIKVIDKLTFYTLFPFSHRWTYIAIPPLVWNIMSPQEKAAVILAMYKIEGGSEMTIMLVSRSQVTPQKTT